MKIAYNFIKFYRPLLDALWEKRIDNDTFTQLYTASLEPNRGLEWLQKMLTNSDIVKAYADENAKRSQ